MTLSVIGTANHEPNYIQWRALVCLYTSCQAAVDFFRLLSFQSAPGDQNLTRRLKRPNKSQTILLSMVLGCLVNQTLSAVQTHGSVLKHEMFLVLMEILGGAWSWWFDLILRFIGNFLWQGRITWWVWHGELQTFLAVRLGFDFSKKWDSPD